MNHTDVPDAAAPCTCREGSKPEPAEEETPERARALELVRALHEKVAAQRAADAARGEQEEK